MKKHLRFVIPGGNGDVGTALSRHFHAQGHEVIVLAVRVPHFKNEFRGCQINLLSPISLESGPLIA